MSHVSEFEPREFIAPLARTELLNRSFDSVDDLRDELEHIQAQARRVREEDSA